MKVGVLDALEARPAVWIAYGLIVGIVFHLDWIYGLAIVPALLLSGSRRTLAMTVLGLVCGLIVAKPPDTRFESLYFQGEVVVKSTERVGRFNNYAVADAGGRRVRLVLPKNVRVTHGSVLELEGRLRPLDDQESRMRGYAAELRPVGELTLIDPGTAVFLASADIRDRMMRNLRRNVPEPEWRLAAGVTLGAVEEMYPSQVDSLRQSGIAHIVATSGLHVLIVAGLCFLILELLPIPRHSKLAILAVIVCIYAISAGLRPSIVRAALMSLFLSGAYLFHRVPDSLSSLSWAGVVILVWNPHQLFTAGFQLSFMAVLALILFVPSITDWTDRWGAMKWPTRAAGVSVLVWLAVSPIIGAHFGRVSLVGPLANIPAVAALPVTTALSLTAGLWPSEAPGSAVCGRLAGASLAATLNISEWANTPRWSSVEWSPAGIVPLGIFYGALFALWNPKRRPIPESRRFRRDDDAFPEPQVFP